MSLIVEISDPSHEDIAAQYQWYVKHAGEEVADRYWAHLKQPFCAYLQTKSGA